MFRFIPLNLEAILREHLDEKRTRNFKRIEYEPHILLALFAKVRELLLKESTLIEVGAPVAIVGDLHGQFRDLLRILDRFTYNGKHGCLTTRFLFLGDYVDRGIHSLECITLLFTLKLLFPQCYFLLRGNHELRQLNRVYGFYEELQHRFRHATAEELYLRINDVFDCLPLAAVVGGRLLCMHGGISPELKSREDINNLKRPLGDIADFPLATDILWSDPAIGVDMFEPNTTRNQSVFYEEKAVRKACADLRVDAIVRAHQMPYAGFAFFAQRQLITIFSAPNYAPGTHNHGAVLFVKDTGELTFKVFAPILFDFKPDEAEFRKAQQEYIHDDSWLTVIEGDQSKRMVTSCNPDDSGRTLYSQTK